MLDNDVFVIEHTLPPHNDVFTAPAAFFHYEGWGVLKSKGTLAALLRIAAVLLRKTGRSRPLFASGLYALVKDFYGAIFSKKPEKIDSWIESAKKYDIPELQAFVEGLLKDLQAIKNGITYPYNNGLAEGSVNKIKVIKRIMVNVKSSACH